MASASAQEDVFNRGMELAHLHRAHATMLPHVWYVLGNPDNLGRVNTYLVNLLEPSCTCRGFAFMPPIYRSQGMVCKHVVCAGAAFIIADGKHGRLA